MAKAKQTCKQFTIVCRGDDDQAIELAFAEAVRSIKDGCYTGHNSNDGGAYYFDVTDDVKKKHWPA